ncbi:unnamed protein product, partial [Nesidiocoris tenuis]
MKLSPRTSFDEFLPVFGRSFCRFLWSYNSKQQLHLKKTIPGCPAEADALRGPEFPTYNNRRQKPQASRPTLLLRPDTRLYSIVRMALQSATPHPPPSVDFG